MNTAGCVFLTYFRDSVWWKSVGQSNQRRPQTTMNQSDLSFDQATNKDIFRLSYGFGMAKI